MEREYTTQTIQVGNCTVILNFPILTDAEKKKTEEEVIQALICYGKG